MDEENQPLTAALFMKFMNQQTEEIKSVKNDIKHSAESIKTQITDISKTIEGLKTTIDSQEVKLCEHDIKINTIETVNDREKRSRNIVIFKIPENETNIVNLKENVIRLILENCKVEISLHVDRIYRIGRKNDDKVRPVLLALTSYDKKMEILSGKKKNQSKLEISEDFSPLVLETRKKLVPVMKKLRELNYRNVQLRQDKLYLDGKICEEEIWKKLIEENTNEEPKSIKINISASASSNSDIPPNTPSLETSVSASNFTDAESSLGTQPSLSHGSPSTGKRQREMGAAATSPSTTRAPKQVKDGLKTTIIGTNNRTNFASPKNPIRDALRKQQQQALNQNTTKDNHQKV